MNKEQSKRPESAAQEKIEYGDVFQVSSSLADNPIAPEDVAAMVMQVIVEPTPSLTAEGGDVRQAAITIGEALVATAQTAGNKPVEQSDAAAIQAAEVRATGSTVIIPGGLSATAQSTAAYNEGLISDQDKIKLGSVLRDATAKLPADKAATREDAEEVITAEELRHKKMTTYPGGVAESIAAAARLNERVGDGDRDQGQ